jgi:3-mercaptopyruvate sulfurtransferase SseA
VKLFLQAAAIAFAGLAVGLVVNWSARRPAPLGRPVRSAAETGICRTELAGAGPVTRISFQDAERLCSSCAAAFVDARSASDYAAGHIANAIHLPPSGDLEEAAALALLAGYGTIVVYDGDASCQLAESVARRLQARGLRDVRVLSGAWPAWVAAGGPGASGACSLCNHSEAAQR